MTISLKISAKERIFTGKGIFTGTLKLLWLDFSSARMYVYKLRRLYGSNSCRSIENIPHLRTPNGGKYLSEKERKPVCRAFHEEEGDKWKSQMTDKAQAGSLQPRRLFGPVVSLSGELVKTLSLISKATHLLVVRHSSSALRIRAFLPRLVVSGLVTTPDSRSFSADTHAYTRRKRRGRKIEFLS
jgi:hypothetical protein